MPVLLQDAEDATDDENEEDDVGGLFETSGDGGEKAVQADRAERCRRSSVAIPRRAPSSAVVFGNLLRRCPGTTSVRSEVPTLAHLALVLARWHDPGQRESWRRSGV